MEFSTAWTTATKPDWSLYFNHKADMAYGSICFLSFLIGTFGNIVSFCYFKGKKRDISSVIYAMITANDVVISMAVLPVGISFWSKREPGYVFGNKYSCAVWFYLWTIAVSLSIFLVICLSFTRTISLLKPFKRQKARYLVAAVAMYLVLQLIRITGCYLLDHTQIKFSPGISRPVMSLSETYNTAILLALEVGRNLTFVAPAFVVATSCIISTVILLRKDYDIFRQRAVVESRNRATATILLFALLYGVCNVPLVVELLLATYSRHTDNKQWRLDLFAFDSQLYYYNALNTLLVAANSAANPVLYFWRMWRLRNSILSRVRRMWGLNRGLRSPRTSRVGVQEIVEEVITANRLFANNSVAPHMPTTTNSNTIETEETRL